ncbi:MAG: PfkB domain protein, partial [Deltaproteobacteria bacterium]|nr:PfkB domain protein [Deltaproteobacteria bacterium]
MKPGQAKLIEGFKGKNICVVGDIIADIYIFGRPYRLSREAPVVVVKHEEERVYPGSAGNTINNLLA